MAKILESWVKHQCPSCGAHVLTVEAAEVMHECPRNGNRPTLFTVLR